MYLKECPEDLEALLWYSSIMLQSLSPYLFILVASIESSKHVACASPAQVLTFLFAGQDSTAAAMASCLCFLCAYPECKAKLLKAVGKSHGKMLFVTWITQSLHYIVLTYSFRVLQVFVVNCVTRHLNRYDDNLWFLLSMWHVSWSFFLTGDWRDCARRAASCRNCWAICGLSDFVYLWSHLGTCSVDQISVNHQQKSIGDLKGSLSLFSQAIISYPHFVEQQWWNKHLG